MSSVSCGIVGLPNAGKSTLFNALTRAGAEIGNYPFTTIDPNTGIVGVPDRRLEQLADIFSPPKVIPASVTFTDIAGLVKGASSGAGLGNQFLGHIRECDAILLVVRTFGDPDVIHVEGSVDATRDFEIIELELILADLSAVEKRREKAEKTARLQKEKAEEEIRILKIVEEQLDKSLPVRSLTFTEEEQDYVKSLYLLSAKPLLVVANGNELGDTDIPPALAAAVTEHGGELITLAAKFESELSELPDEDQREFLSDAGFDDPGLSRLIRKTYSLLGLQTFFTAGEKEVRAWTIRVGDTAVDAAGTIHTDFAKGFIKAEVVDCAALIDEGSYVAVREHGKQRLEGKDYVMQDGDVVHFRFNT